MLKINTVVLIDIKYLVAYINDFNSNCMLWYVCDDV